MKTEITALLGTEYPIIQGGMAWVAEYHLAAAVSEAGGLGIIGAANAPAAWVREQIHKVRELTGKPFGVNVMLMSPYAAEVAEVIAEEKVPVVTTGAGNPEKYMELWKNAGVKVIPVVASTALAKRMERCGADAVIAEGCESGGHVESTFRLSLPADSATAEASRRLSCWELEACSWEPVSWRRRKPRFMKTTSRPSSRRRISTPG